MYKQMYKNVLLLKVPATFKPMYSTFFGTCLYLDFWQWTQILESPQLTPFEEEEQTLHAPPVGWSPATLKGELMSATWTQDFLSILIQISGPHMRAET